MAEGTPEQHNSHPEYQGSPLYGYDSPAVQEYYEGREAAPVADFFLPHLQSGISLLDAGCGPGTITLGLAEAVDPGQTVGIDIEPSMIERANTFAKERKISNVRFQVADICALPFPDSSFDAVFTSAVLEHLSDPGRALRDLHRVVKSSGLVGVISTDWGEPLISPPNEALARFFELFEKGFNRYGGSLNRGRHLRVMMRQAGFDVIEFSASYGNSPTPETVQSTVRGFVAWMENLPLFDEAIELGWVDRPTLDKMGDDMKKWAEHPDAFLANGRCKAIGRKG